MLFVPLGIAVVKHYSDWEEDIKAKLENFDVWACHERWLFYALPSSRVSLLTTTNIDHHTTSTSSMTLRQFSYFKPAHAIRTGYFSYAGAGMSHCGPILVHRCR